MFSFDVNNYLPPEYNFNNQQPNYPPPPYREPVTPKTFLKNNSEMPRKEFYEQLDDLQLPKYYGRKVENLTGVIQVGAGLAAGALGIVLIMTIVVTPSAMFSSGAPIFGGVFGVAGVGGLIVAAVAGYKLYHHQTKNIGEEKIQKVLNQIVEGAKQDKVAAEKKLEKQRKITEQHQGRYDMLANIKTTPREGSNE